MSRLRRRDLARPWGRMRVWSAGAGPGLLAIHGLGGSGRYWQGLADGLGHRFTVIAPDLGGFGGSDKPELDYDRTFHLADLDAVVAETAPAGPLSIVGHSLGGVLGALWLVGHPDRVSVLALAATPFPHGAGFDGRNLREMRPSLGRRTLAATARSVWPAVALPVGLARGYSAAVVVDFGRPTVRARAWTLASLLSDPALPGELSGLSRIDPAVPTLLLYAADDRRVPLTAGSAWASLLPSAARVVVPSGGHQFLLRTGFDPLTTWFEGTAGAG